MLLNISKKIKSLLIVCSLLLVFCTPIATFADSTIRAQDVKIYTPHYTPVLSQFDPPLGQYEYRVAWQGIPAAYVGVNVSKDGMNYRVVTTAKTYRAIDLFYRLRYRAEGEISALDLKPIKTVIDHRENSRHKITRIVFKDDGEIRATRYRVGKKTEKINFKSSNFTLDPFSAAFLARGISWKVGDEKKFDTFNGKSRYLILLKAVNKQIIHIDGKDREVWTIVPTVKNLTNPKKNSKLRSAKIYLSTDKSREILKITSKVFIGSVSTTMISFVPTKIDSGVNLLSARRQRKFKKTS